MDTAAFLQHVLPRTGKYILAEPTDNGEYISWKYSVYDYISQAAEAAQQYDASGRTVYFACNSYGDWYKELDRTTGKERSHLRTQKNVVACRSLYDDIDIGKANTYSTRQEAGAAVKALVAELKLLPTIVNSGGGMHLYWTLDEDISSDEWLRLSMLKRAVTSHFGLKVDRAVDIDSARVLRPIGTHNRKLAEPREVKVTFKGGTYSVAQLEQALLAYVKKHGIIALPPAPKSHEPSAFDDLSAGVEYPPSSAFEIIKHCGALGEIATHRGNVSEPMWRAMIGILKHTIEGEDLAHEWSAGHPEYDPTETQKKLDNWSAGPTRCETFATESSHCANCPRSGKIKSPIVLGYSMDTAVAPEIKVETEDGTEEVFTPPHWPHGFHWNGNTISKAVRNEDGGVDYVPFSNILFYPIMRVRTEDGTWGIQIRANPFTRNDRTFVIPTKSIAEPQGLGTALASYEVFTSGRNGRMHAQDYLQSFIQSYQTAGVETITYPHLGWYDDGKAFVLGSTRIEASGETEALPGKSIGDDLARAHECSGDLNTWVDLVDMVYNREGAEAYQMVICAAFASPLVEFTASATWHGIPIALTGASGAGKTSAMAVACSLYGPPDKFLINAGENGVTLNAAIGQFAAMRNMPVLLDEITGRSKEDVRDLLYALSNGRAKIRMTSTGEPHPMNKGRWNMLSFISGNAEFSDMLSGLSSNVAEATELRVFDIKIPECFSERVWPGVNVKEIIEQQLSRQYGHAGRKWIKFLIRNKEQVTDIVRREMSKWAPNSQAETQERFYYNTLIHTIAAGRLAKKLGLIRFDMDALWGWGIARIQSMRSGRATTAKTPDDYLSEFLASIHGKIVITKRYRQSRTITPEMPLEPQCRGTPIARQAVEDKKLFVSVAAFNTWCRENGISPSWLRDELVRRGNIVRRAGDVDIERRECLGKGTTLPLNQTRVYELDYARAVGDDAEEGGGKILHMPGMRGVEHEPLDMTEES